LTDLCNFFVEFLKKVVVFASEKRPFFDQKRAGKFCKRAGKKNFLPVSEKKSPKTPSKNSRFWAQKSFWSQKIKKMALFCGDFWMIFRFFSTVLLYRFVTFWEKSTNRKWIFIQKRAYFLFI